MSDLEFVIALVLSLVFAVGFPYALYLWMVADSEEFWAEQDVKREEATARHEERMHKIRGDHDAQS